ncbi:extracellular solute-binding protein [Pseudarthrobacter sp. PS3-L1]|nr:extracellular solute-binding protein [Pseudarthrobacter sp. PS3-L1]MDJ0318958.1 extracellular solute-binding protein [Pseudarthrobacter sp. PS3-L1]
MTKVKFHMKKQHGLLALATASALMLSACGSGGAGTESKNAPAAGSGQEITLWLAGGDTNDELRAYLKKTFQETTGSTLVIEEQSWGDIVTKLTTALPDSNNTPDVVELGNTQSPTFTNVGAFSDISDMYKELGGADLLQSFVDVGTVEGANFTLPYYFGSRYMFQRKDVWSEAGVKQPTTLEEFNATVEEIANKNPRGVENFSGFFLGGQDWRNGISWVFANGGDLARKDGDQWVSTLGDSKTLKGLGQLRDIYQNASKAPADAKDATPWLYINDKDEILDEGGKSAGSTSLAAATIMAPGWAHTSIGDLGVGEDGKPVRQWNDETFGAFVLPGNDGKPAPVFAGGSNIGISAASQNQELSKELLKIIFSEDYQNMLGKSGLGPGNQKYVSSLGDDQFAKAAIGAASNSKLTPAAPGWAAVEGASILEEFFGKIAATDDLKTLADEYDKKITPMLNVKG